MNAPPPPGAAAAVARPARLDELAVRCRRQHPQAALLHARFALPGLAPPALDAAGLDRLDLACARRLRQRIRADDELHRLGPFDYAVLLRRTGPAGPAAVALRLMRWCASPEWARAHGVPVTLQVTRVVPPQERDEERTDPVAA